MRPHPTAAAAFVAASVLLLAGCGTSSSHTSSDSAATSSPTSDPVAYLHSIDQHHSRADDAALIHRLQARCTDNMLVLEFTATNTALGLVDATHTKQYLYPVLAQLADDIPAAGPKTKCARRLPAAAKQVKAKR